MIRHGTVTHEEYGVDYELKYEFCDGDIEPMKWLMNGFDLDLPARIEDRLIGKAYEQERERQHCGELNYD